MWMYLKIEPKFPDVLDVEYERKRGVRHDSKIFQPNNYFLT